MKEDKLYGFMALGVTVLSVVLGSTLPPSGATAALWVVAFLSIIASVYFFVSSKDS